MRRRRRSYLDDSDDEVDIDMTSMMDVVFILLIFFVVTTSFVKPSGITVDEPVASTAQSKQSTLILVGISPTGQIWVQDHPVDLSAIRATVARLHAQTPQAAVMIQADKASPSGVLVQVMNEVRLAGVDNVAVAARKK